MQESIVTLIVLVAACAVARTYLPASVRRRSAAAVARTMRRVGLLSVAARLDANLPVTSSRANGCGSCRGCDPGAAPNEAPISTVSVQALKRRRP